jgi:hypothetical protein
MRMKVHSGESKRIWKHACSFIVFERKPEVSQHFLAPIEILRGTEKLVSGRAINSRKTICAIGRELDLAIHEDPSGIGRSGREA